MQPFLKRYYTISATLLLTQYDENRHNINQKTNLNIFLNDANSITPVLFTKLNALKNNYIFSLPAELIGENDFFPDLLPKLYLFAALNCSPKETGIIIPIFFDRPGKSDAVDTDRITAYFHSQGIDDVKLPFFNYTKTSESIQNNEDCSFVISPLNLPGDINRFPADKSIENAISSSIIIGFEEDITDLTLFDEITHQIAVMEESSFRSLDFDGLSQYYIEKEVFEKERELWKKRVLLYQDFLSLSKTVQEKEYYEVLDWYHKEYEILPLWYKRVGHIIKVLMGKRTFRSLFNNKVKKH